MSNSTKIGLLIAVVLIAICAIVSMVISSNRVSGTVESTPKQMKPGARAKKLPVSAE